MNTLLSPRAGLQFCGRQRLGRTGPFAIVHRTPYQSYGHLPKTNSTRRLSTDTSQHVQFVTSFVSSEKDGIMCVVWTPVWGSVHLVGEYKWAIEKRQLDEELYGSRTWMSRLVFFMRCWMHRYKADEKVRYSRLPTLCRKGTLLAEGNRNGEKIASPIKFVNTATEKFARTWIVIEIIQTSIIIAQYGPRFIRGTELVTSFKLIVEGMICQALWDFYGVVRNVRERCRGWLLLRANIQLTCLSSGTFM